MGSTKTTATQVGRDTADKVRESVATNELAQRAREAMYTVVGLGVMGAQRATAAGKQAARQLQREDADKGDADRGLDVDALKAKTKDVTDEARRQFSKFDEVLAGALARIEEAMAPLEERLPPAAKDTVQKVKVASKGLHAQIQTRMAAPEGATPERADHEEIEAPKPKKRASANLDSADAGEADAS